jgi:EpsI family protein
MIARRAVLITLAMALASLAAWYLTPRAAAGAHGVVLAQLVPRRFGEWRELEAPTIAVDPRGQRPGETDPEAPYDDVLMRSYTNARGDVVMLALAYGRHQRQEMKIHRPELCYTSQGYTVLRKSDVTLVLPRLAAVEGARMLVTAPARSEAVSYWIRIGDLHSQSAWKTRAYIFSEGMQGRVADGMLVRVSQVVPDMPIAAAAYYELQEKFLSDLVGAMPVDARRLLLGGART